MRSIQREHKSRKSRVHYLMDSIPIRGARRSLPPSDMFVRKKQFKKDMLEMLDLEDTNLVSNIHGLRISRETHERLLETESSDHGVDLLGLHSVQLVDGVADLLLVGTEVDEEGEDVLRLRK